jgi:hypothetical protein
MGLTYPYFLFLFLLLGLFFFWRQRKYFLRHAYVKSLAKPRRKWLHKVCEYCGWILLILAATNPWFGYTEQIRKQATHRYVLINDGSGSMIQENTFRGVGVALTTVESANEAFLQLLSKRSDGAKDLVGAIVFSNDAFIVSYMVDDPLFVGRALKTVDYSEYPLRQGTEQEKAFWAALEMLLTHTKDLGDDIISLRRRMYGTGVEYEKDAWTKKIVAEYSQLVKGSSIIMFTDGEFDSPYGSKLQMSSYKIINLCRDLGVRIYIVSVARVDPLLERCVKRTGGVAKVFRNYNQRLFNKTYEDIVRGDALEQMFVDQQARRTFGTIIGAAALLPLFVGLLLRLTTSRSFTDI